MSVGLSKFLEREHLERIKSLRPDDLAPSLGTIIRAITIGSRSPSILKEARWAYYRPETFFENTELTDSFTEIIKQVVEGLENGSVSGIFLNLGMGSGKTHLLSLLLHLFVSCRLNPFLASEYLDEYRTRTGYSEALARKTVVIAVDMRTPESIFEHLKLTEIILRDMENYETAGIIKESIEDRRLPDPKELAEKIPEDKHILILIDELHYAVVMGSTKARELAKQFITFILDLINYRREIPTRKGGVILVVASARRDFESWERIKDIIEDKELVTKVDGFIRQLQRVEKVVTTRWLSLSEVQRILEKRLKLKVSFNRVFYESFNNRFIERIIKADSDIPQAHHMRSLIKAMAIYALNALDSGENIVSPAHFSEEVIDTLLGNEKIAMNYKSIYSEIMSRLENTELIQRRKFIQAVNTVFTYTITGNPKKLIEMLRLTKRKESPTETIPLIKEVELRNILVKVHGLSEKEVINIISNLDAIHPNIHGIRLPRGEEAYFIAPIASVLAIYKRMIKEKEGEYLTNPDKIINDIERYARSLQKDEDFVEQNVILSLKELEKKPHSKDKLYIYIYFNKPLLSQLSDKLETKEESFKEMLKEVRKFYERKPEHNIIIVVPKIKKRVLNGISTCLTIEEATAYVINNYIAKLEEDIPFTERKEEEEIVRFERELLKLELSTLESEIGKRLSEAISSFASAMASLLDTAVLYIPPKDIREVDIKLDVAGLTSFRETKVSISRIQEVLDKLRRNKSRVISNVAEKMIKWITSQSPLRLVTSISDASRILLDDIKELLEKNQEVRIFTNEPKIKQLSKSTYIYIPSRTIKTAINSAVERVKEEFSEKFEVIRIEEGNQITIKLKPRKISPVTPQIEVREGVVTGRTIGEDQKTAFGLLDVVHKIAERGGGTLWIAFEITKESIEILTDILPSLTRYIKDYREEGKHEA